MNYALQVLSKAKNRDALLLAEVAAWLHDDFKHTDVHIHKYVSGAPAPSGKQDAKDLIPPRQITLLGQTISFSDAKQRKQADFVTGYLNRCHYTAHIEKQDGDGPQNYPAYTSSPFGHEGDTHHIPAALTQDLRSQIDWQLIGNSPFTNLERTQCRKGIEALFSRVGGDTRRPANEITLWEWGHTVGALYKAALAGALMDHQPAPNDLRWRLLSIRFDGPAFFAEGHHLPDLLARRKLLGVALDQVRELLEVTYPLGTEVYRDEDGSIFVVPGCEKGNCTLDLLVLEDSGKTLREHILDRVSAVLEGEVIPKAKVDPEPWWGQDPQRKGNDEIPPISEHLRRVLSAADPHWTARQWRGDPAEICTVCGLRPQGPGRKALGRQVCDVCECRRADRAEKWAGDLTTTIWTDEVADVNGRLALIVGRFDLNHWLDGTMVKTLLVTDPQSGKATKKNPSFARLRRVWETTRHFWQEVAPTDEKSTVPLEKSLVGEKVGQAGPRLEIRGSLQSRQSGNTPGDYHAYELVLPGGVKMSVVWDTGKGRFITVDNLDYLAKEGQLGRPARQVLKKDVALPIEEPVGYGAKNKVWDTITVESVNELPDKYTPAIPILAEPRTFMALVPADQALEVVQAIKTKYEREMGKVRNRLPITLGLVYFGRRTPLSAAMEAGRRMLAFQRQEQTWTVKEVTPPLPRNEWPEAVTLILNHDHHEISITVKTVMGDQQTPDVWYPYWHVEGNPSGRTRQFTGPDGGQWVHVCDLKPDEPDDRVSFSPSTFDFEYLDTTARRFEVSYIGGQRRGKDKCHRPYLLEELEQIEQVWAEIQTLSTSQIKALESLIETKRVQWGTPKGDAALALPADDPFRQLCRGALATAGWRGKSWHSFSSEEQGLLERAALSGMLADTLELHLTIAKEDMERKSGDNKEAD